MEECRPLSMIYVKKIPYEVDMECFDMAPDDKAVYMLPDGSLGVAEVINFRREGLPARAALVPLDDDGFVLSRCEIIGRVVRKKSH